MMTRRKRIIIIHKSALIRLGIRSVIKSSQSFGAYRTRTYAKAEEAFGVLAELEASNIIMLDSSAWATLETLDGRLKIQELVDCGVRIALIASVDHETVKNIEARGIRGLLPPHAEIETVLKLLHDLAAGRPSFYSDDNATLESQIYRLSGRQLEILRALCRGRLGSQVATDLGVSRSCVKEHLGVIRERLGFARRSQVIAAFSNYLGGVELA